MTGTADLICRDRRIEAPSLWANLYRDDILELCRRHGEDPDTVSTTEYDVIDAPLLRFDVYLRNDEGNCYLACGCGGRFERRNPDGTLDGFHDGDCTIAMATVEQALIGALPHWWQP